MIRWKRFWVSGGTITALTIGFLLGAAAHAGYIPLSQTAVGVLNPLAALWMNAIRMTVFPLLVAQVIVGLVRPGSTSGARLVVRAAFTFAAILVTAALIFVPLMPGILKALPLDAESLAAIRGVSGVTPAVAPPAQSASWPEQLVPPNPVRAVVEDNLLGVLVFAIAGGLAVRRLAHERRTAVAEVCQIVADAMMTIIGWVIWMMPLAAFAVAFSMATAAGSGTAHALGVFIAVSCALLLVVTLALYPLGAFGARMSIRRFSASILNAQLVGFTTRSSFVALPSMVECARTRLQLRPDVTGVALPLAVSSFRLSPVISASIQFLFVASVYGVELSAAQIAAFALAMLAFSFNTPGIPGGGVVMRYAPLYVAAGVPLEAYLITDAVEPIPDLFKTVLNVTAHLTIVALVDRQTGALGEVGAEASGRSPAEAAAGR